MQTSSTKELEDEDKLHLLFCLLTFNLKIRHSKTQLMNIKCYFCFDKLKQCFFSQRIKVSYCTFEFWQTEKKYCSQFLVYVESSAPSRFLCSFLFSKLPRSELAFKQRNVFKLKSELTSHINNKRTGEAREGVEDDRLTFDQWWLVCSWGPAYLNACWLIMVRVFLFTVLPSLCVFSASYKLTGELRFRRCGPKRPRCAVVFQADWLQFTSCCLNMNAHV